MKSCTVTQNENTVKAFAWVAVDARGQGSARFIKKPYFQVKNATQTRQM